MDSIVSDRIHQLQSQCEQYQKQAKYRDCIHIMEEIVSLKKTVYGLQHVEFQKSSEKLCEYLNLAAMFNLQKQQFESCIDYLRKAQLVCQNSLQFKSTTYNNLACYYRRIGKLRTALSYLIQTLELQLKLEHPTTLADTHLNLCAVLSSLDKHEDALQHSMLSIILLQDQLLQGCLSKMKRDGSKQINDQRIAVLTISYHNMGVQFEYLKRYDQALKVYNKALDISSQYLPQNQKLVSNMKRVVDTATEQIEEQRKIIQLSKRTKMSKQATQNKRDIYKQISKQSQRFKNLPKLKIKDDYPIIEQSFSNNLGKTIGFKNGNRSIDKHFITKKKHRVYKSTSSSKQVYDVKSTLVNPELQHLISNQLDSPRQNFTYNN